MALTPEVADALVLAAEEGVPTRTALLHLGVAQSTFYEWLAIGTGRQTAWRDGTPISDVARGVFSAFSERLARAKAGRVVEAVQRIRDAAKQPDKFGRPDWRAEAWLLTHSPEFRDEWGERVEMRHTGTVDHTLHQQMREAGPRVWVAAAPELALLLPAGALEDETPPDAPAA